MLARYLERSGADPEAFPAGRPCLAAQRNLKILGLFTRLCRRDGKPRYLGYLPRVWAHLAGDLAHPGARAARRPSSPRHVPAARARRCSPASRPRRVTPQAVMIFAAGLGTRMGALTRDRPKPLIEVAGRPLIDHALALVRDAGIRARSSSTPTPTPSSSAPISPASRPTRWSRTSPMLLETGGGLKRRCRSSGPARSSRSTPTWSGAARTRSPRSPPPGAGRRRACSASCRAPPPSATAARATSSSAPTRASAAAARAATADFVYAGAQIIDPAPVAAFPERGLLAQPGLGRADRRRAASRGVVHPGGWVDVGRPEGIALAEAGSRA